MARSGAVLSLLLLGLLAVGASASVPNRFNEFVEETQSSIVDAFNSWAQTLNKATIEPQFPASLTRRHHGGRDPEKVYLLVKNLVRPSKAKEFVKAFMKTREGVKGEKGNVQYSLSKTMTDNLIFYTYAVWESKEDFKEHIGSDYVKDYVKFLNEEDIAVTITGLLPVESLDDM